MALALIAWIVLAAASGAATLQWYEHYEEGLAAEERGAWEEALESFRAAERFRPEPAARARTYGNRFLFDYDPFFHQARCLVELERPVAARAALARSEEAGVTPPAARAALVERIVRLAERTAEEPPPEPTAAEGIEKSPAAFREVSPPEDEPAVNRSAGPPDEPARMRVDSVPSGVPVRIDGRPVGRTPVEGVEVEPGLRRVEVGEDGPGSSHRPRQEEVEVARGERVHLTVALAPRAMEPAGDGEPAAPASPDEVDETVEGAPDAGADADRAQPPPLSTREDPEPEPEPGGDAGPVAQESTTSPTAAGADGEEGSPSEPAPEGGPDRSGRSGRPGPGLLLAGMVVVLVVATAAGLVMSRRRRQGSATPRNGTLSERVGQRVGAYRIDGILGRGGMATTYRAQRVRDRRPVALKIPHETGDPTYLELFLREGRLGETLHHPGIVRILEAGEEGERPFLAMELIPGRTLREVMDSAEAPLPVERALAIARAIAEAMDYAHGKGVIHRDLKPENVMVLPDGSLKVMDFGVARVEGQPGLTTSRFFFGSPVYAAPELVDPRSIDRRADLYSLGVMLYELLEGEPPFVHESIFKLLEMHQREPLPEPEGLPRPLSPALWHLVARLLAKEPDDRYASAQELLVELKQLLHDGPGEGDAVEEGAL